MCLFASVGGLPSLLCLCMCVFSLCSSQWNNMCVLIAVINRQRWVKQDGFEKISTAPPAFQCFLEAKWREQ